MAPSLPGRIVVISLFGGWMTAVIARDALAGASSDDRSSARGLGGTFGIILLSFQRLEGELVQARDQLQHALDDITTQRTQIKVLEGLLPICAWCRKIKDQKGAWTQMEVYIRDHSQAGFSRGIFPDCMKEHIGRAPAGTRGPAHDPK
ncbi:MAG TPA: hypothetical protein VLH75_19885 [Longimicrobiales bacterium]|nr:hypothetical protein [Longimicrobiales bacterium]